MDMITFTIAAKYSTRLLDQFVFFCEVNLLCGYMTDSQREGGNTVVRSRFR
jgi:hypothetical protein